MATYHGQYMAPGIGAASNMQKSIQDLSVYYGHFFDLGFSHFSFAINRDY
jgi:hypothetical protein